jgi:hypothetical protein
LISKFHEIRLFPDERVVKHLHHRELIDCIFPVLLVCPSMIGNERIPRPLANAARTKEGTIVILLRLAGHERNGTPRRSLRTKLGSILCCQRMRILSNCSL